MTFCLRSDAMCGIPVGCMRCHSRDGRIVVIREDGRGVGCIGSHLASFPSMACRVPKGLEAFCRRLEPVTFGIACRLSLGQFIRAVVELAAWECPWR